MRSRHRVRRLATRLHVWIGWIVGLQILAWTVSGLFMVLRPIEEVRGEHLRRAAAPLAVMPGLALPKLSSRLRPVRSLELQMRLGRPFWVVHFVDGDGRLANTVTGRLLPPISAPQALALARADYAGPAEATGVTRVDPDAPPIDYRRDTPAWRVDFADGSRLYVDAGTGAVLMRRTPLWRSFDFMWGLHIMDWRGREDTSHFLLQAAAILSLVSVVAGLVLLPLSARRGGTGPRRHPLARRND